MRIDCERLSKFGNRVLVARELLKRESAHEKRIGGLWISFACFAEEILCLIKFVVLALEKTEQIQRVEILWIGLDDGSAERGGTPGIAIAGQALGFFDEMAGGIQPRDSAAAMTRSAGGSPRRVR